MTNLFELFNGFVDSLKNIVMIFEFIVPGYIFLTCYNYAAYQSRETEKIYLIIKCISISFCVNFISMTIATNLDLSNIILEIIILLGSLILGFIFGAVRRTKLLKGLSLRVFRREMANNVFVGIWEEAEAKKAIVKIDFQIEDDPNFYKGQLYKVSDVGRDPQLTIAYYSSYNIQGNITFDYSTTDDNFFIIKYSSIKNMKIHYCYSGENR